MKKNLWDIFLGLAVGGVTTMIGLFFRLTPMHIAIWAILIGILGMAASRYSDRISAYEKRAQSKLLLIIRMFSIALGLESTSILQTFETDNITTIRIERRLLDSSGIYYRRDMKRNPHEFVYPFVQFVNVSPIQNKLNYLDVGCTLMSALHHNLELYCTSATLVFNGTPSKRQPIIEEDSQTHKLRVRNPIVFWAEGPNQLSNFRIYLGRKQREDILRYYSQNRCAQVDLEIEGIGKGKVRHRMSTGLHPVAILGD